MCALRRSPQQCHQRGRPERWGRRESELFCILHLSQIQTEITFLDHQGGHRLAEGIYLDFRRSASSSFPEDNSPLSDAAIDMWSSSGVPNQTQGAPREGPVAPLSSLTAHGMLKEREVRGDLPGRRAPTVTLRSPKVLTRPVALL